MDEYCPTCERTVGRANLYPGLMPLDLVDHWWLFAISIAIVIGVLVDGVPRLARRRVPVASASA